MMSPRSLVVGMVGENVAALQNALAVLGFNIPEAEHKRRFFGPGTRDAVRRYQSQSGLTPSGQCDDELRALLGLADGGEASLTPPAGTAKASAPLSGARKTTNDKAASAEQFTVSGRVFSPLSGGVGGLSLQLVDKNAGPDVPLAAGETERDGSYCLHYSISPLLSRGKAAPDLQIRVLSGHTLLCASEVRYDARLVETLDVPLPDSAAAFLPTEYETLTAKIAFHHKGRLADLKEADDRSDFTYLANKTGADVRSVAMAALADQIRRHRDLTSGGSGLKPAFYYALFRAGLPADPDGLFQTDAKTVEDIWRKAIEQSVIPAALAEELPGAVETFRRLSAGRILDIAGAAGGSTPRDMLRLVFGDDRGRHQQFANIYTRLRDDPAAFWGAIRDAFGESIESRLRLDGQLGYLTLNNARLIGRLYEAERGTTLSSTLDLVRRGYYRAEKWLRLIDGPIPEQVPGEDAERKRSSYAELLAAQMRLSFPTAVVAELVREGEFPLPASERVREGVYDFLSQHHGKFEIGAQPIGQYLGVNADIRISEPVKQEIKRLQRVYQITPNDEAMSGLLKNKIDSAYEVVRYSETSFIQSFGDALGGEDTARLTYARSQQIHNAVLNIAVSYLTARTAPPLGMNPQSPILHPLPDSILRNVNGSEVPAYPTLEGLFGSMDYCACAHCRSILSPAAYLVDLLMFLDKPGNEHTKNPQEVLLDRRPDIGHLPLTCENTNVQLPAIDVVNEILEYFVSHGLSLAGFAGHDTGDISAEELAAEPQFVDSGAYDVLKTEYFPPPLPFQRSLEILRRLCEKFGVPLQHAMTALRANDNTERGSHDEYAWRDILMEELSLSRTEYQLLTDNKLPLAQVYGFPANTLDGEVQKILSNAKQFARRAGLSYEELASLLTTAFINPNINLIPKLERLGVALTTILAVHDGRLSSEDFTKLLPTGAAAPDPAEYDGDIVAWIKDERNYRRFSRIITLTDTSMRADSCDFGKVLLSYPSGLLNGSFEVPVLRGTGPANPIGPEVGWKFTTNSGIRANGGFMGAEVAPAGSQAAYITHEGRISQTLSFRAGRHVLSFFVGGVTYYPAPMSLFVELDELIHFIRPEGNHFNHIVLDVSISSHGPHTITFRRADGNDNVTMLDAVAITSLLASADLIRLLRFVRLWRKLGWTIDQTDRAVTALFPREYLPTGADETRDLERLDAGFLHMLPRLGIVCQLIKRLKLKLETDLPGLLACWAPIDTHGPNSPYRQMFLTAEALRRDPVFADNGYGEFLPDTGNAGPKVFGHIPSLCAAFELTGQEFGLIAEALEFDVTTPLTLPNISAIFRHGWLARKLRVSVAEFLGLMKFTGLDPFPLRKPQLLHSISEPVSFVDFVQALRAISLTPARALYLIWNYDVGGNSVLQEEEKQARDLALRLRTELAAIETEFAIGEDAGGDNARSHVASVYGQEDTDFLFSLIDNAFTVDVSYEHPQADLERDVFEAAKAITGGTIAYDHIRKLLSFFGLLNEETRNSLIEVASGEAFRAAVDDLFAKSKVSVTSFFERYPDLRSYAERPGSPKEKRDRVLADVLPKLKKRRQEQQALAVVAAAAGTDVAFARAILSDASVLHAVNSPSEMALEDALAVKTVPGQIIIGKWTGYLSSPEGGAFEFVIETAPDAIVTMLLEGADVALIKDSPDKGTWRKQTLALSAEKLHAIEFTVHPETNALKVLWQTAGRPLEIIPEKHIYCYDKIHNLGATVSRFRRIATLAGNLQLSASEIAHLAIDSDYQIHNTGWFNALPVGSTSAETKPSGYIAFVDQPNANSTITLDDVTWTFVSSTAGSNQTQIGANLNATLAALAADLNASVDGRISRSTYKLNSAGNRLQIELDNVVPFEPVPLAALPSTARGLDRAGLHTAPLRGVGVSFTLSASPDSNGVASGPELVVISQALSNAFCALLDLARIKAALSPNDERFLAVLKNPQANPLFGLIGWEVQAVDELLGRFGKARSDLVHIDVFRRVYDAYAQVTGFRVPVRVLLKVVTNEPEDGAVRELQAALRARYAKRDWLAALKPINDAMRILQRDALVAYILRKFGEQDETKHIDTPDKLFDLFLTDVLVDPCVQTSRIRHALASVQLFIDRCLMNLERSSVPPSAIEADKWDWMKRYRVWEANRKVFLWPENWLEPELRDDQSPFFREAMSELLQSDITEESASVALLNYLTKLEEVAKLEPCSLECSTGRPDAQKVVTYLVARTPGANQKYFLRRREGGTWTPWETINLDIQGDPKIAVWRGRVLLFWVRLIKEAATDPEDQPTTSTTADPLASLSLSALKTDVRDDAKQKNRVRLKAVLCWSEYYNGKWVPERTSNVQRPQSVGGGTMLSLKEASMIEARDVSITAFGKDVLLVSIRVKLPLSTESYINANFYLRNLHTPVDESDIDTEDFYPTKPFYWKGISQYTDNIYVTYVRFIDPSNWTVLRNDSLIQNSRPYNIIAFWPYFGTQKDVIEAPFIMVDQRYCFYITTEAKRNTFARYCGYGDLSVGYSQSLGGGLTINQGAETLTSLGYPLGSTPLVAPQRLVK